MKLFTSVSIGALVFGAGTLMAAVNVDTGSLEGQVFHGSFTARPLGSPTTMEFKHMLEFRSDWTVVDNAPTWYGREPVQCQYGMEMKGKDKDNLHSVVVICNGLARTFKAVEDEDGLKLKGEHAILARATAETPKADL